MPSKMAGAHICISLLLVVFFCDKGTPFFQFFSSCVRARLAHGIGGNDWESVCRASCSTKQCSERCVIYDESQNFPCASYQCSEFQSCLQSELPPAASGLRGPAYRQPTEEYDELPRLPVLPPECSSSNYNRLYDSSRLYKGSGDSTPAYRDDSTASTKPGIFESPDWQGAGYYRFTPPAGSELAILDGPLQNSCTKRTSIGELKPATRPPVGRKRPINPAHQQTFQSQLVTTTSISSLTVTNCGDFLVYYLPDVSNGRYCGQEKSD